MIVYLYQWAKATNDQITKQKLKSRFAAATKLPSVTPGAPPNVSSQDATQDNVSTTSTSTTSTLSSSTNIPTPPNPQIIEPNFIPKNSLNSSQQSLPPTQFSASPSSVDTSSHSPQQTIDKVSNYISY